MPPTTSSPVVQSGGPRRYTHGQTDCHADFVTKGNIGWGDVFEAVEPGVFLVGDNFYNALDSREVRQLAAHEQNEERLMAGDLTAFAFLDGGVTFSEQTDPDSWNEDVLEDGIWIVGWLALRAVCDAIGVPPPSRLDGEPGHVPEESLRKAIRERRTTTGDPARQAEMIETWSGARELLTRARTRGSAWIAEEAKVTEAPDRKGRETGDPSLLED